MGTKRSFLNEGLENGKVASQVPYDLSACTHFQICGKKGAFHLPHIDRGGVITTLTADDGYKLCPVWPGDSIERIREWAASGSLPNGPCVGLYLPPGSCLVMPGGLVHGPCSLSNVLMTGTVHWDSRSMCRPMELSALEKLYPHITKEEPAKELRRKIYHIQHLWERQSPVFEWGSAHEYQQFMKLIIVRDVNFTFFKNADKSRTSGRRVNVNGNVESLAVVRRTKSGVEPIATGEKCQPAAGIIIRDVGYCGHSARGSVCLCWVALTNH